MIRSRWTRWPSKPIPNGDGNLEVFVMQSEADMGKWLGVGIAIGTGIGVAMGNIGMGVAIGVAIGVALSAAEKNKAKKAP